MNARETAWRIFAGELNASSLERKGDDDTSPSYVVTPLGSMVNRVMAAGVMTEKENIGTDDEPMWKARVQDVTGSFFLNVGRYQPEAAAAMANLDTPAFVAVIGKVRTYSPEEGRVYVSLRPEKIVQIDDRSRNLWILEAAESMWDRLLKVRKAVTNPDAGVNDLIAMGLTSAEAEGITMALDHYGDQDSSRYLSVLQSALRMLLPDREIDLGLPEEVPSAPEEIEVDEEKGDGGMSSADKEDVILALIEELDDMRGKGAPRSEIDRRAAMEGISEAEVEEISDALMDKGLVYEPNLGYLRKI